MCKQISSFGHVAFILDGWAAWVQESFEIVRNSPKWSENNQSFGLLGLSGLGARAVQTVQALLQSIALPTAQHTVHRSVFLSNLPRQYILDLHAVDSVGNTENLSLFSTLMLMSSLHNWRGKHWLTTSLEWLRVILIVFLNWCHHHE